MNYKLRWVKSKRSSVEFDEKIYTKSNTAIRLGIDNEVKRNSNEWKALFNLHDEIVLPIYNGLVNGFNKRNLFISSGYRCPELNAKIGGAKTSQHTKGEAVDLEVIGFNNYDLFQWIKKYLDYDQLISEYYKEGVMNSGWIHVSYKSKRENRKQSFEIGRKS